MTMFSEFHTGVTIAFFLILVREGVSVGGRRDEGKRSGKRGGKGGEPHDIFELSGHFFGPDR